MELAKKSAFTSNYYFIWLILILVCGFLSKIRFIKFFTSYLKNLGNLGLLFFIFSYNLVVTSSSNGKYPHIIAYKIIPLDQISTAQGSYGILCNISGEAQQGDPQAVLSISPSLKKLPKPKSAIFILSSEINMFYGFMSLCATPLLCKYYNPRIIWAK